MSHPFVSSVYSTTPSATQTDPNTVMAAFMSTDPNTAGTSLPPLSHLLPASSASAAIVDLAAVAAASVAADNSHLADVIDLTHVKSDPSTTDCNGNYSFITAAGQKKRPRRKYHEIERLYHCNYLGCSKAYGTLNHLNAHVAMQNHGPKRLPVEFKEMRKQWRKQKREQRAAAEAAVAAVSAELSIPPAATATTTANTTSQASVTANPSDRPILTTSTQPTTATSTFPSAVAAAAAASMMMGMDPDSIALSYGAPHAPLVVSDHHHHHHHHPQHHHTSLMLPSFMPWQSYVGMPSAGPHTVAATVALPPY